MNEMSELAKALAAAQGEFTNPTKDRTNPHFKNKYATLDSMQTATREILSKHGLAVVQLPTMTPSLITRLIHSSGQYVESETPIAANLRPQEYGSALTYMRRYSYAAILNITADEDDDAEAASTAKPQRAQAVRQTPATPPPANPPPAAVTLPSARDNASDWVDQQRSLYAAALTIEAVDAITATGNVVKIGKEESGRDKLKRQWPDLFTLLEKARLDAEERVIDAAQATGEAA